MADSEQTLDVVLDGETEHGCVHLGVLADRAVRQRLDRAELFVDQPARLLVVQLADGDERVRRPVVVLEYGAQLRSKSEGIQERKPIPSISLWGICSDPLC